MLITSEQSLYSGFMVVKIDVSIQYSFNDRKVNSIDYEISIRAYIRALSSNKIESIRW